MGQRPAAEVSGRTLFVGVSARWYGPRRARQAATHQIGRPENGEQGATTIRTIAPLSAWW
jgi:hypothetical protein